MFYAFDTIGRMLTACTTFTDAMNVKGVKFVKFVKVGTIAVPRNIPRNWEN